MLHLYRVWTGL